MFGLFRYPYCLVYFGGRKGYHYRVSSSKIQAGSHVIVPVGKYDAWKIGVVLSVKSYSRFKVPYPLGKTKFVIKLAGTNAVYQVERHNRKLAKRLQRAQKRRMKQLKKANKHKEFLAWIDAVEEMNAMLDD